MSEADWNDFVAFIGDKEYDYVTKSEKSLDEFKKNAEDELYFTELKNDIENLKLKLKHDKQTDIQKNRADITSLLEDEIVSRYGYLKGRIKESLTHDLDVKKAIEVLNDQPTYTSVLKGTFNASVGSASEGK